MTRQGRRTKPQMRVLAASCAAVMAVLSACTNPDLTEPTLEPHDGIHDVAPVLYDHKEEVTARGIDFAQDGVHVDIPRGALAGRQIAELQWGPQIGRVEGPYLTEEFGAPISITHESPLLEPVTITWDIPEETSVDTDQIVRLVRWDEDVQAWKISDEPVTVTETSYVVEVQEFSIITWISTTADSINQMVGRYTGTRADDPSCGGDAPSWVQSTVAPGGDAAGAVIKACFETGPDDTLRIRLVNNRPYAQLVSFDTGVSVEPAMTVTPSTLVWSLANELGPDENVLLAPLQETNVLMARPSAAGYHHVGASSEITALTVLADFLARTLDSLPIGGTSNPALNALLQVVYECGGQQLAGAEGKNPLDWPKTAVDVISGCVGELARPDSDLGRLYESAVTSHMNANLGPDGLTTAQQTLAGTRVVEFVSERLALLKFVQLSQYAAEISAGMLLGPSTFSINAVGTSVPLGEWEPTCTSLSDDSDALFRNLALQDAYQDTSLEYWQFPEWYDDAAAAVVPLTACDPTYLAELSEFILTDWADRTAVGIVGDAIRGLNGDEPITYNLGLGAREPSAGGTWLFDLDSTAEQNSANKASIVLNRLDEPLVFDNSTDQWVGCNGETAQTTYELGGDYSVLEFGFGLRDHAPDGMTATVTLTADGTRVLDESVMVGAVLSRTRIDVSGVERLLVEAKTGDTCRISSTAYGAFLDAWVEP